MKLRILITTADSDYAEHLSNNLSEKHADTFEVSVCSSIERLSELLAGNRYDVALMEPDFATVERLESIRLPLALVDETSGKSELKTIRKYQQIPSLVGKILEYYADVAVDVGLDTEKTQITAVWSPSGGCGKTTVALAYAAHKSLNGKQVVYLNLENFTSTSAYFGNVPEKSISKAFGRLETENLQLFLMGIRQVDNGTGIMYFCGPENYKDIDILTAEDLETLVNACTTGVDEVVVDLSSQCDGRVCGILNLADTVLLVNDPSSVSITKLYQFINQHNIFGQIREKIVLVNNKGAVAVDIGIRKTIQLPLLQVSDPIALFKSLSGGNFNW